MRRSSLQEGQSAVESAGLPDDRSARQVINPKRLIATNNMYVSDVFLIAQDSRGQEEEMLPVQGWGCM